jgi:hypothetical protein
MRAVFTWNDRGKPPDYVPLSNWWRGTKQGDVELHFLRGPLAGYKLTGFVVVVGASGRVQVILPNRTLWGPSILRPIGSSWIEPPGGMLLGDGPLKRTILAAYYSAAPPEKRKN